MKFSGKEDIEAPIEFVFEQITDFTSFERSALRRGTEVQRLDQLAEPGPGMQWDASFKYRGRKRELNLALLSLDAPNTMVIGSRSPSMGGQMVVDLVALSRGRTRMSVEIALEPRNLSARLLVQSLKLARNSLNKRFRNRIAAFAEDIEERYRKSV